MLSRTEQVTTYPIALLLSNSKRKTFESLGVETGKSGDTIARLATKNLDSIADLINLSKKHFGKKKTYLLIDDTLILKIFSRLIEGTSDNYSSSDRKTQRSLCSIVAMVTDGVTAIPINQIIWTSKEFNPNAYKTKWELAKALILKIKRYISVHMVIMDGLYAISAFMKWLCSNNIGFEMRFHSNRVIERKGYRSQVKHSKLLKLKRGRMTRTSWVIWQGMRLYVTAQKRLMKNGTYSIVFLVSNFKATSRKHVKIYGYRWSIEKFFRTAKQKLGLNDCQSRKLERQKGHIINVFFAYAVTQCLQKRLKLKNAEEAIKSIKKRNFKNPMYTLCLFTNNFCYA